MDAERLGPVRIIGTGLLGTSLGLALTGLGVQVLLRDRDPAAVALAEGLGAGQVDLGGVAARLVVVAAPPDVTADLVAAQLIAEPQATVVDVASVKSAVVQRLREVGADLTRYVGCHPMAGRERSGPAAARGDLFTARPWAICAAPDSDPRRVELVHELAVAVGAVPLALAADRHDLAVALVSHVPQVAASLVAAQLAPAPPWALALAGQGVRDVTRIAASDPQLWVQILAGNADAVVPVLRRMREDLDDVLASLTALSVPRAAPSGPVADPDATSGRQRVADLIARGNAGRGRIPGKHGEAPARYEVCTVVISDRRGQLGSLFSDIAAAGVNIEEIRLEHAPGRAVGLVELSVRPAAIDELHRALADSGWAVVG